MSPPSWIHVDRAPRATHRQLHEFTRDVQHHATTRRMDVERHLVAVHVRRYLNVAFAGASTCTRQRAACGAACQSGFPLRATSSRTSLRRSLPVSRRAALAHRETRVSQGGGEPKRSSAALGHDHTAGSVLTASLARDHRNCICPPSSITMGPVMS